jgi:hypothetical protein
MESTRSPLVQNFLMLEATEAIGKRYGLLEWLGSPLSSTLVAGQPAMEGRRIHESLYFQMNQSALLIGS